MPTSSRRFATREPTCEVRNEDAAGVGTHSRKESDDYRDFVAPSLRGIAARDLLQITPWVAITPVALYIKDPGEMSTAPDALALVLRVRIRFRGGKS